MTNAAASKSPNPAPSFVSVINRENCVRILAYLGAPEGEVAESGDVVVRTRRVVKTRLFPGANLVAADVAKACGVGGPDGLDPTGGRSRLLVKDPTSLDDQTAIDIATITASKPALRAWLGRETRPEVRSAIESTLAGARPDAED